MTTAIQFEQDWTGVVEFDHPHQAGQHMRRKIIVQAADEAQAKRRAKEDMAAMAAIFGSWTFVQPLRPMP